MRIMDLNKSIEEIDGEYWGDPEINSHVAIECHRLRKIPLTQLSIENLRLLIGQKIALQIIVPMVFDILEENPLAEGDLYKGDLLANMVNIPQNFWENHPELKNRLVEIKNELEIIHETIKDELLPSLEKFQYQ